MALFIAISVALRESLSAATCAQTTRATKNTKIHRYIVCLPRPLYVCVYLEFALSSRRHIPVMAGNEFRSCLQTKTHERRVGNFNFVLWICRFWGISFYVLQFVCCCSVLLQLDEIKKKKNCKIFVETIFTIF